MTCARFKPNCSAPGFKSKRISSLAVSKLSEMSYKLVKRRIRSLSSATANCKVARSGCRTEISISGPELLNEYCTSTFLASATGPINSRKRIAASFADKLRSSADANLTIAITLSRLERVYQFSTTFDFVPSSAFCSTSAISSS